MAANLGNDADTTCAVFGQMAGAYWGPEVLYHELSYALHHRIGRLRRGRSTTLKRDNEIVAEIAAATLIQVFEGESDLPQ